MARRQHANLVTILQRAMDAQLAPAPFTPAIVSVIVPHFNASLGPLLSIISREKRVPVRVVECGALVLSSGPSVESHVHAVQSALVAACGRRHAVLIRNSHVMASTALQAALVQLWGILHATRTIIIIEDRGTRRHALRVPLSSKTPLHVEKVYAPENLASPRTLVDTACAVYRKAGIEVPALTTPQRLKTIPDGDEGLPAVWQFRDALRDRDGPRCVRALAGVVSSRTKAELWARSVTDGDARMATVAARVCAPLVPSASPMAHTSWDPASALSLKSSVLEALRVSSHVSKTGSDRATTGCLSTGNHATCAAAAHVARIVLPSQSSTGGACLVRMFGGHAPRPIGRNTAVKDQEFLKSLLGPGWDPKDSLFQTGR